MSDRTNPKDLLGVKKAPLGLVPPSFIISTSDALADGAAKYGAYNYRETDVRATVYLNAALRHIYSWQDGEENAEDSGFSHLSHAAACLAILVDTQSTGRLIDDRPAVGAASKMLKDRDKTVKEKKV
jgi:hypothetical protein